MKWRNYFRLLAEDQLHGSRFNWFWKPNLSLASFFYGLGLAFHRGLYQVGLLRRHVFDQPVISVGNLTWGGTGKTPLVEYLTRWFSNQGRTPLILARGYGGDEKEELTRHLPRARFGFGQNRVATGRECLKKNPADVIILDDGFQHWPIKRDLDIVAVNVLNPFGNLSLIPRGVLREGVNSLKRASIVVLTDIDLVSRKEVDELRMRIHQIAPRVDFVEAYHEPLYFYRPHSRDRVSIARLQGKRVTSFSGIGTPRSFLMLLNRVGVKSIRNFEYSDHHNYSEEELSEISQMKVSSQSEEIITTEKDLYRSEELITKLLRPMVLKVRLSISGGDHVLRNYLNRIMKPVSRTPSADPRVQPAGLAGAPNPVIPVAAGREVK
jgi:tetraacyldisaccharide 4'-kinase